MLGMVYVFHSREHYRVPNPNCSRWVTANILMTDREVTWKLQTDVATALCLSGKLRNHITPPFKLAFSCYRGCLEMWCWRGYGNSSLGWQYATLVYSWQAAWETIDSHMWARVAPWIYSGTAADASRMIQYLVTLSLPFWLPLHQVSICIPLRCHG